MGRPSLCTREAVKTALDSKLTARDDAQVDRAREAARDTIEGLTHRRFYPEIDTRSFDWPNHQYAVPWRLWLDSNELISVTSIVTGGQTLTSGEFILRRSDDRDEPPYTHVEINLDSSAAWSGGSTHQRSIAITGLYAGCPADETPAGALAAQVASTTATRFDVTDSSAVGVGDLLRVDSERVIVGQKLMLDTGQNLVGNMAAQASDQIVDVADGTQIHVGEVLLIEAERMLAVDVAGNNVVVKRAWDGSTLAAHTAPVDIYAARTLTVERGALGTTAATHAQGAAVALHLVPAAVRDWAVAESICQVLAEQSGYARTTGSGDNERESAGRQLEVAKRKALVAFGRKARSRAI